MHMQQALERTSRLPTVKHSQNLKRGEKATPTIDPLPIGRRSNPGPAQQPAREHPSRKTSSPEDQKHYSRRRQQHRLTQQPTPCSPHSPSRYATVHIHEKRPQDFPCADADTIEQDMYGLKSSGHHGVQQWRARQPYKSFKSQYGPRYAPRKTQSSGGNYRAKANPNASHSYQIPKLKLGQYTPGALLRM